MPDYRFNNCGLLLSIRVNSFAMNPTIAHQERIKILESLDLLRSHQEKSFDEITELAALICQAPIALISFLGEDVQVFKSHFGWDVCETLLKHSFCAAAVESNQKLFEVEDAREHPRFKDNPMVKGEPGLVFYAGIPLIYQGKVPLGAICVMDFEPRTLSAEQIKALESLSHQVMHLISLQMAVIEKELAVAKAKEEKEMTSNLVGTVEGIFWIADPDTLEFKFVSPQSEKILGYTPQEWINTPDFWKDRIHPDDREFALNHCLTETKKLKDHQFQYRMRTKSGNYIWVEDRVVVKSQGQIPAMLTGFIWDISQEKILALSLKEESRLNQQIVQSLPGLFLMFDEHGKISLWNTEFLKFSGYSEFEIPDLELNRLFNSKKFDSFKEVIRNARDLGELETEVFLVSKAGEIWPFLLKISKIEYSGSSVLMACGLDLSVVIQAKKELDQTEYKFKSLVQDGGDLIAILDLDGIYKYVSPTSTSILGISPEEFVGNNAFEFIHFEDLPQVLEDFQSLQFKKRISISPFRFKNAEGEWRWIETTVTNLIDDPAIGGVVANSRDVTEKIVAHQELAISEQLYKVFLESQTNFFIRTDLQGNYTFANRKFIEEFGWIYEGEILGKNSLVSICEYHHPRVFETVNLCLEKPGKVYKVELDKPSRIAGEVVTTLWDFICIHDSNGTPQEIQCSGIDVTDTVYYEKELRRSNERFELVNQATKDAIYDWDLVRNQLTFGESFTYNFGHQVNPEEPMPIKVWEDLLHPEDKEKTIFDLGEFLQNPLAEKWEMEYRLRRSDGSFAYVEEIGTLIRDGKGLPVRMVGVLRDITEYKGIQLLLDDSTTISKLGGWEIDMSNNKLIWTKVVYEIHELPMDFIPTIDNGLNFYREDYREIIHQAILEVISTNQSFELEAVLITSTGKEKWVRVKGHGEFQNEKCLKVQGSIQDIHSRKLDELEIRYQHALLKSLTEVIGFLFQKENWSEVIDSAFGLIGNTIQVDRIYLFENHTDKVSGIQYTSQKFEWVSVGTIAQLEIPLLQNVPLSEYMLLFQELEQNLPFVAKVSEIQDQNLKEALTGREIKSILLFPVFIEEEFWGFVGFDDYKAERDWKQSEINFLKSFTSNLESAIKRRKDQLSLENLVSEKNRILESIGDGFFVMDNQGTINYWNRAAEVLIGIPREQVVGYVLWDRYPGATKVRFMLDFMDLIEEQEELHVEEYYPEFGKWFEISAYPFAETISVFFRDITERKNFEEAIIQSNERFEIIAKATNDIVWDYDIQNKYLFVSEGFNSQFGYDDRERVTTLEQFLDLVHPEERDLVENQLKEMLKKGTENTNWGIDYRLRRGDGRYSYIQHKSFFIRDRKGKAVRAMGAMVDITPRKEYEESLKLLNFELEMRVKELAVSNLELEQFAYVTSHDLQEPLRMISSFLTLLETKYGTQLDEKAKMYIGFAVDGAKRMRQLILDLLDYSRSGKNSHEKQWVDLSEIVHQVYLFNKKLIEEKKGEIHYGNLPKLFVSKVSMYQVLQNLVENAFKYARPDVPSMVLIEMEERESEWLVAVKDNGIGIVPEFHEKIFVIFQRLHTREKYLGTGIGLAIVKKQVESWGGKIWVNSNPEEGSTFYFTVPK